VIRLTDEAVALLDAGEQDGLFLKELLLFMAGRSK
jgi:hypothetical protein